MSIPSEKSWRFAVFDVLELARHEVVVALRTWRALLVALFYLGTALISGAIYVLSLRFMEQKAIEFAIKSGAHPTSASASVSLLGEQAYQNILAWLAGGSIETVNVLWRNSTILPALLWGSLLLLPFVIILTCYDQVVSDLTHRTLCFSTLRVSRLSLFLGKVVSQGILFSLLTAIASLVFVVFATLFLSGFKVDSAFWGLLYLVTLLLPFGLLYVCLALLCSSLVKQPIMALLLSFLMMLMLRVFGWLGHIPETHDLAMLRYARFLSPSFYEQGFWQAGFVAPMTSVLAYLAFAVVFGSLAYWRLSCRDL